MWEKGISAYIGLDHPPALIHDYLTRAQSYGYRRLFTSLHIPEAKTSLALSDFQGFMEHAAALGYKVTADISAQALALLGASLTDLSPLTKLGLTTLRLDYGFSPGQIASLSKTGGLEIELNASTVTPLILQELQQAKADFTKIRACHNYYPRPETGLSMELFAERSKLLRQFGIAVFAFIPSLHSPRAPIFAGLPTLEKHRQLGPALAAKELLATGYVDGILFGDPLVSDEELAAVAALDSNFLELQVRVAADLSPLERRILFADHTNRYDPGEKVIRSQEARLLCSKTITGRPPQQRPFGAVTIDNESYLRYMGELQVICSPLPADHRVNLVAQIIEEELFLLTYLTPGKPFRFKEVK